MTVVLTWVRKSKGSDDDIGLEEQRATVDELAHNIGDNVDSLDLGVQTGFSTLTRDSTGDLLDENDRVLDAVDRLREGEYDYLVAFDDRRVCRDGYMQVIKHVCKQGDCKLRYVADVPDDDMVHDIHRRVERQTKQEEIEKSQNALRRRADKGYYHGPPLYGLEYDDHGEYLVPDPEFDAVTDALNMRDNGATYSEIVDETGMARGTLSAVLDRRELYEAVRRGAVVGKNREPVRLSSR